VCVQQEKFEAWTVYRRYNSFLLLRDQLLSHHPQLPVIPHFDPDNLRLDNLESCRVMLDRWLQVVASNSYILRMQSMYQFLCIDANMPPPYLEIHWRDATQEHLEDMQMDEMFDGKEDEEMEESDQDDEDEEDEDEDEEDEDEEGDWEEENEAEAAPQQTVFGFPQGSAGQQQQQEGGKKKRSHSKTTSSQNKASPTAHQQKHGNGSSGRPQHQQGQGQGGGAMEEDEQDGLDIQSLSVVENAEFIYNKIDDSNNSSSGKASSSGAVTEKKKTINLEAFKIIRVIGKGEHYSQLM
jgi:hypothetical protein